MIVQKFTEPRSVSSGCKIILTSNIYCMGGGVRFLINKAHISLIIGMVNEVWIGIVKLLKKHFSRLLTKEDFRRAVKERWSAERSLEFEERMRMLIPAQFPKVWGETRIANKIGMVGDLTGRTHRINTGGDERYMSLYLRRVSESGLDWPSKLTLDQYLPLHAPLLDFLVEDAKRIDAWRYPKLEELEKYQRIRGLNMKMLERIEVRELVCGVSSAEEILEVRKWVEEMQDEDQRLFGTRVVSFDVEDVKATYFDTLRMAGKATIDPKNAVLKRKCDPEMMTDASKDKFKQIPGKIMFGNGVSWTCLISLDLKRNKRKEYVLERMTVQPELLEFLRDLPVAAGLAVRRDVRGVEEFYSLISGEDVRLERGFLDLTSLAVLAGYKFQSRNMTAMGVQVIGTLLNKNVSTGDDWWGERWQLIPESLKCYALGDIQFGFMTYNILAGLLLRDVFPDPEVLCKYMKCGQKDASDWFLEFVMVSLEGVEYHQRAEEEAETREEMILSLRYRDEREKLFEFSPPLIRLWTQILGKWPAPTSGGCRYLLEAREWFLVQMAVLAQVGYTWSKGRRLEPPGREEKEYARFGLEPEELEKQVWLEPVGSFRGLERPKGLRIPLLVLDMEKVKSKEIGEKCTRIGRCQRWSLLEWARMNPRELVKFFMRMERNVGFQQFYGGLYDAMRLCYQRMMDKKAPVVEIREKRLKLAVLQSLEEESEGLRKCEEELRVRRMRVERLTKLSEDWEYEERTRWREEAPLPNPKVRSGVKRKKSSKPGKQKRMRMRSAREAAAGSRAEEPVDLSPSQPSPGSSRGRSGFGESVSRPLQGGGSEEVVILEDEDDVFLEAEEERSVRVASPKRRSAALKFSRKVVERTPTYDERIEGSARDSPREEMDLELDVPWEDRMF